jgi:hypothetical protein
VFALATQSKQMSAEFVADDFVVVLVVVALLMLVKTLLQKNEDDNVGSYICIVLKHMF